MCNCDKKKTPPTSLEHWTAHKVYLQGLIANEPDCPVLQGDLEDADRTLAAIAAGTYKRAEISFFTAETH